MASPSHQLRHAFRRSRDPAVAGRTAATCVSEVIRFPVWPLMLPYIVSNISASKTKPTGVTTSEIGSVPFESLPSSAVQYWASAILQAVLNILRRHGKNLAESIHKRK